MKNMNETQKYINFLTEEIFTYPFPSCGIVFTSYVNLSWNLFKL